MRKLISVILTVLLMSTALFVCFPPKVSAQYEWFLTIGTSYSVESCLDPAEAYDYFGWEMIRSLGSGLVDYRAGATGSIDDFVPALATSWNVSADGLKWTFNLRQDVRYDDGTEFDASHVKYTFDRGMGIADPQGPFFGIGYGDIIQNVTVIDKYTVEFFLKMPFGPFLSILSLPVSYIVDPKYALMHGTAWSTSDVVVYVKDNARASNPLGLGPYKLASWNRTGGQDLQMVLVANPNYWGAKAGYPRNAKVIIKFYADSASLALAVQNHEVDVAFKQLGTADIDSVKSDANLHVWEGPCAFIQYLCLQEHSWPFNETKIRQAVGAAVNRTALVSTVLLGQAQKLYSLIPNGMASHVDAFLNLGDPNYTLTRELLAGYGFNETNKLAFTLWYETSGHYPQSAQQAQVLKSSIESSGVITVNLGGLDWPGYMFARRDEAMQAFIMGWYPDYVDADNYVYFLLHSKGGSWLHDNYINPVMDQLVEWARGNISTSARESLYQQIQDLAVSDCPIVPLYQGSTYVVTSSNITGISLDITQSFRIWSIDRARTYLPSDVNSDGTVDLLDALLVSAAFGSDPRDPRWRPEADMNNDNVIDIYDVIILSKNFGEHYP